MLYDRATSKFDRQELDVRHELFERIFKDNPFTGMTGSHVSEHPDRPLLILSSTSYTPDENFMVMIEALDLVQEKISKSEKPLPGV